MAIQKLVLQVTILCDTDTLEEATASYSAMDLEEVHESITSGEDIGSGVKIISAETLTDRERITDELLLIGNDGTFFDCNLDGVEDLAGADA